MRKDTLTTQKARLIKEMLWKGKEQARIAVITGVSQATVSRIKKGFIHQSIPWPDGTLGAMPQISTLTREEEWSASAQRILSFPQDMQDRIYEMVNKRRKTLDLPPIPPMASAYQEYLMSDPDEDAEMDGLEGARVEEDKRLSTIGEEFDAIVEDELSKHRDDALLNTIAATQAVNPNQPPPPYKGPPRFVELPWSSVISKDPTNPLVREAVALGDPIRIKAICIVFAQVAATQESWRSSGVARLVQEMEQRLYTYPDLVEEIRGVSKIGTEGDGDTT
jgi:hypothetical protein